MGERKDVKALLNSYIPTLRAAEARMREWDAEESVYISSPKMDGMPRNPGNHGLELLTERRERARRRAEEAREKLFALEDEIWTMISSLKEPDQSVLKYRYMDGLKWIEVADRMHYSERTILYIHGRALNELRRRQ